VPEPEQVVTAQADVSNKELRDGKGKEMSPEKSQVAGRVDEIINDKGSGNKSGDN
jgi:hypothetical protein